VTFTFGSSGNFAKQLIEGAPFDVYASANVKFVDDTIAGGACDAATKALYGRGRLVIFTKQGLAPAAAKIEDLADARFVKVAIANPQHAPYGKAAQQALETTGAWAAVQPKLVFGDNIQQTFQFVQTGNVEAAVIALSLAIAQADAKEGVDWVPVDDKLHQPLDQALAVCKHGGNPKLAQEFAAFVNSPEGRAIMTRYGFVLPGESVATP
jgi:molybdate transport system substrate-binding protein